MEKIIDKEMEKGPLPQPPPPPGGGAPPGRVRYNFNTFHSTVNSQNKPLTPNIQHLSPSTQHLTPS